MKSLYFSTLFLFFVCDRLSAATIQVIWSTDRQLGNQNSSPLSSGSSIDGDGTLLQLGFYNGATTSNPFSGAWIVLTTASVGDTGINQAGWFSVTTTFVEGTFTQPAVGTPLAIRFYNGTTVGNSQFFNAASDTAGTWNWIAPGTPAPVLNLAITKGVSVFQSNSDPYLTAIPVPEPTAYMLLMGCSGLWCLRRRKAGKIKHLKA